MTPFGNPGNWGAGGLNNFVRDNGGTGQSAEALLPLVYAELRTLAAARLQQEIPGQTLQPTALVHEAYLRLVASRPDGNWDNTGHFFAAAAEAMRRILVDHAREKAARKRGGNFSRRTLDPGAVGQIDSECEREDLLALDDALTQLEVHDPLAARFVKLRYFGGLTVEKAAEILEISPRSAYYTWTYARTWLRRAIVGRNDTGDGDLQSP